MDTRSLITFTDSHREKELSAHLIHSKSNQVRGWCVWYPYTCGVVRWWWGNYLLTMVLLNPTRLPSFNYYYYSYFHLLPRFTFKITRISSSPVPTIHPKTSGLIRLYLQITLWNWKMGFHGNYSNISRPVGFMSATNQRHDAMSIMNPMTQIVGMGYYISWNPLCRRSGVDSS